MMVLLTPNQEAITLLSGFAFGQIKMAGDVVQHFPTNTISNKLQMIGESLQELEEHSLLLKKKIDGSANRNKAIIAKKEPKTKARLLAEKHPRTNIPDCEIRLENIIAGSPAYVPYKKIPKNQKGKGKFGKQLKFPISSHSEMPRRKQDTNPEELVNVA